MKEPDELKMIVFLLFMHVMTTANAVEPLRTRLVGGSGSFEGRVEVLYQGAWGTVCDDYWGLDDAHVVCHTLGYPNASVYYTNANFGQGTGEIILDDVQCTGSESNIAFCQHNGYLSDNCVHSEDAGVTCDVIEPLRTRLVGGSGSFEGRVEVYYQGAWGTVCDDYWDLDDAHVVCHTLGYPRASAYYTNANFGKGTGEIIMDDVHCMGSESNIAFCQHNGYLSENCGHHEDAGVTCDGIGYAYLYAGSSSREGLVRVRYQGTYGSVCDHGFDLTDAHVVCRMLGHTFAESFSCCAAFGSITSGEIFLNELQCTGEEVTIGHCMHNPFGAHDCGYSDAVGVTCIKLPVRLVDGASANEGRVEVNYQGSWGTICDDSWDINDATVVCRMLGYPGVSSALVRFGEGTGDIILDEVQCDGSETHIAKCTHGGYEFHDCSHVEDVGVICSGEAKLNVRLVDGPDESQGRVELFYFGSWGTVCHYSWTSLDSEVVCRMLGFIEAIAYSTYSSYGRGTGEVILRQPRCSGNESSLLECDPYYDLGNTNCGHSIDLGVSCLKMDDLQVRLVGGRSDTEGRVEILYLGTWGTVCDDNWGLNDANVVCRMLGYERAEKFSCCAAFGLGSGPIVLDEVECEGTEPNIGHCRRSGYEMHDCDHSEDVGVSCIEYDIDECEQTGDEYPCDALNGQCTNTHGSYICSCSIGYRLDFNDNCQDIDECEQTGDEYPCDALNGQCTNTQGSYVCSCSTGYRLDLIDNCQEVDQESSTTMITNMLFSTTEGSKMGQSQSQHVTFGLIGFLFVAVIGILLGCIVMTVMMRKYRRSANEASSQQQVSYPQTVEQNCYNGPQLDEEGYLELNVVPPKLPGGSSRDKGEAYETPRHGDREDAYENIQIQEEGAKL